MARYKFYIVLYCIVLYSSEIFFRAFYLAATANENAL